MASTGVKTAIQSTPENRTFAADFRLMGIKGLKGFKGTKGFKGFKAINNQKHFIAMTKEELNEILRILGLDEWRESAQIYVFYRRPDGVVENFSLNVRRGREMTDEEVIGLMRREYPASREGEVLAVERPKGGEYHKQARADWLDVPEVCQMLNISTRTLRKWTAMGVFSAYRVNGKLYYERNDIDRAMRNNIVMENGRLDKSCLATR